MSMMNSGRVRLAGTAAATAAFDRIGVGAPVAVMTMSASTSACPSESQLVTVPPTSSASSCACASVRLVITMPATACAFRCSAVSLPISPAPMTSTRRPASCPKIFLARLTAAKLTDTAPSASAVSDRTRLPTPKAQWNRRLSSGPALSTVRRGRKRVLDLAEDLRLADNERVEAGGDAEQMARRVVVDMRVEMRSNAIGRQLVELGEKRDQILAAEVGVLARDVQLRAVARRDDDGLGSVLATRERAHGRLETAAAEIQPLPELHGGCTMTGAD